jgi:hypothetical protein
MSSPTIDFVGTVGDPTTQGLGRLISQYVNSPKLIGLLSGIYSMGKDLDALFQRLARVLNIDDDITYTPDGGATYPANTNGAIGDQLKIIGNMVGVTSTLPNGTVLSDSDFRTLVKAKRFRNSAVANMPSLRLGLWWIFDPSCAASLTAGGSCTSPIELLTEDLGHMTVRITLIYYVAGPGPAAPSAAQLSLLHLKTGRSNLPYALLPRPAGVELGFQWQPRTDVYSFSDVNDITHTPLSLGGVGWNITTGVWASAFV